MTEAAPPIGVYVHWPFCVQICPYCDFNVYKARPINEEAWRDSLIRDLTHQHAMAPSRRLSSVYFGGGTPSLMSPDAVGSIVDAARALWAGEDPLEITLEANPTDAEVGRFRGFRDAGVNRLSLGVQAFEDDALAFLGRNHDGADARRALEQALNVFDAVSMDLIYALPEETGAQWRSRLRDALRFGAPHLSAYQLTIEPGTAFEKAVARRRWSPPGELRSAQLYDITQEETTAAGLPRYEISNHARSGFESRHNRLYWNGLDYAGAGPGAHGRLTSAGRRHAVETIRNPQAWLESVRIHGHGLSVIEPMTQTEVLEERVTMGLRQDDGVLLDDDDWRALEPRWPALARDGFLVREGDRMVATPSGAKVLNAVLAALLV